MTDKIKTSHTPGPWVVGKGEKKEVLVMSSSDDFENDPRSFYICEIIGHADDTEESANARLIAAAPDLLEACKAALNFVDDIEVQKHVIEAIAKATGE